MKYFPLVWAGLFRRRARTVFTLVSILAAFLLFGMLNSVRVAFGGGSESLSGAERLVVASRFSIMTGLPQSLKVRIAAVPGVAAVAHQNWFGGVYQDPKNFVVSFAVDANYLDVTADVQVDADARAAFERTRDGALVGEALARRYGWKVGDRVPLTAQIFPRKDGSMTWPFVISGLLRAAPGASGGVDQLFLMHWEYFDEGNLYGQHTVGWYLVKLLDPERADEVAAAIDALSANSDHETKSQTANAFNASFARQLGDIGLIVTAIMGAVFFTLILLTGNAMAQAVRERIPELATLKALGFSSQRVLALVLAEALLLLALGGVAGLLLASVLVPLMASASGGMLELPGVGVQAWLAGLALMLAIGLLVGLPPAWRGMRLRIVDALAGR